MGLGLGLELGLRSSADMAEEKAADSAAAASSAPPPATPAPPPEWGRADWTTCSEADDVRCGVRCVVDGSDDVV